MENVPTLGPSLAVLFWELLGMLPEALIGTGRSLTGMSWEVTKSPFLYPSRGEWPLPHVLPRRGIRPHCEPVTNGAKDTLKP